MTEHTLLLKPWEARAFAEKRKSLIVRPVKPQPIDEGEFFIVPQGGFLNCATKRRSDDCIRCPFGIPGDTLVCKETWATDSSLDLMWAKEFFNWPVRYLADGTIRRCGSLHGNTAGKTRHAPTLPRWAVRTLRKNAGVRVERLNELTEEDAAAAGFAGMQSPIRGEFLWQWDADFKSYPSASNPWVFIGETEPSCRNS